MLPAKIYTVVVPAGGMTELAVVGEMFKVLSASGSFIVSADTWGTLGNILAGQGLRDASFTKLQFTDNSGAQNTLRVLVAGQSFIDDRITGEVSVIDGGMSRTLSNQAYVASSNPSSDATTGPAIYLQNPAGSGKNIIVKSIRSSLTTAQSYGVCWAAGVTGADDSANGIISKSQTGAFVGKLWKHTTGVMAASIGSSFATANLAANAVDAVTFAEPLVIVPGGQIRIFGSAVSSGVTATMECVEQPQ